MPGLKQQSDSMYLLFLIPTESSVSGTTTDAWVTVLDVDMRTLRVLTMAVKNDGGVNTLKYRTQIRYANYDSGTYQVVTTGTVAPAGEDDVQYAQFGYARVLLQLASNVAGQATDYTVEYLTRG